MRTFIESHAFGSLLVIARRHRCIGGRITRHGSWDIRETRWIVDSRQWRTNRGDRLVICVRIHPLIGIWISWWHRFAVRCLLNVLHTITTKYFSKYIANNYYTIIKLRYIKQKNI